MYYSLLILLLVASVFEGTITSLPLVLVMLIVLSVNLKKSDVFLLAFISGLVLDVFLGRTMGMSSIFFLSILLLVFLYDRKYEITSLFFVLLSTTLGTVFYLFIFPSPDVFLQVIICTVLAGGIFSLSRVLPAKKEGVRQL